MLSICIKVDGTQHPRASDIIRKDVFGLNIFTWHWRVQGLSTGSASPSLKISDPFKGLLQE